MLVPFACSREVAIESTFWFPYYLMVTVLANSAFTLYRSGQD